MQIYVIFRSTAKIAYQIILHTYLHLAQRAISSYAIQMEQTTKKIVFVLSIAHKHTHNQKEEETLNKKYTV